MFFPPYHIYSISYCGFTPSVPSHVSSKNILVPHNAHSCVSNIMKNTKKIDNLNKKHIFIYSLVLRGFSLKTPTVLRIKFLVFLGF